MISKLTFSKFTVVSGTMRDDTKPLGEKYITKEWEFQAGESIILDTRPNQEAFYQNICNAFYFTYKGYRCCLDTQVNSFVTS